MPASKAAPAGIEENACQPAGPKALTRFREDKKNRLLFILAGVFLAAYFIPWGAPRLVAAVQESFLLLGEYARQHVLFCLVPAFFIAGAIMVFLNQQSVIKYLGPEAPKLVAHTVASVSGTILAVCSCTVLPLFKGIYKKGAGIGPAVSFLYSGPAINILAIILTAKVLGWQLGLARAAGAVVFAFLAGLLMHLFFRKEDAERTTNAAMFKGADEDERGLGKTAVYMASMIGILVFLNWAPSKGSSSGWDFIFRWKYLITGAFALLLVYSLIRWFTKSELKGWVLAARDFAVQILPLLFGGVLVAGFLLGRPGHMALIPEQWIAAAAGGNSLLSNFVASFSGALMYFATLTEVPIMQGLLGSGMGQGPALALLLAGPSLSLPSLLVIGGELGFKKTITYALIVVVLSTCAGMVYGALI
ncbi:MAG: permease [Spirochaetales bacterium]|nr:MAG: permease [Spirochaetales bacterium]